MKLKIVLLSLLIVSSYARSADLVDKVVVFKSERIMQLRSGEHVVREYAISLGDRPVGHKEKEGDEKTPEGDYIIDYRNPNSSYHLSLHISYPNEMDKQAAKAKGVSPGGMIMIHGLPNKFGWLPRLFEGRDWTDGCIAVNDNEAMEEIWEMVANGTPITINP